MKRKRKKNLKRMWIRKWKRKSKRRKKKAQEALAWQQGVEQFHGVHLGRCWETNQGTLILISDSKKRKRESFSSVRCSVTTQQQRNPATTMQNSISTATRTNKIQITDYVTWITVLSFNIMTVKQTTLSKYDSDSGQTKFTKQNYSTVRSQGVGLTVGGMWLFVCCAMEGWHGAWM